MKIRFSDGMYTFEIETADDMPLIFDGEGFVMGDTGIEEEDVEDEH